MNIHSSYFSSNSSQSPIFNWSDFSSRSHHFWNFCWLVIPICRICSQQSILIYFNIVRCIISQSQISSSKIIVSRSNKNRSSIHVNLQSRNDICSQFFHSIVIQIICCCVDLVKIFFCNVVADCVSRIKTSAFVCKRIVIICWETLKRFSLNRQNVSISCCDYHNFSFCNFSIAVKIFKCCNHREFISSSFSFSTIQLNSCCAWWNCSLKCAAQIVDVLVWKITSHFFIYFDVKFSMFSSL